MAALTPRIDAIDSLAQISGSIAQAQGYTSIVDTSSKIDVPGTAIINRAQIPNLAADLGVRMGIERIMTQRVYPILNEQGLNGEQVFGVEGDVLGQIRCVGSWYTVNDSTGSRVAVNSASDYVEITFYGTGLNILVGFWAASFNWSYYLDGSVTPVNFLNLTTSSIIAGRNYSPNQVVSVVSGLSAGLHTVKIVAAAANLVVHGFEILNEASNLNVRLGTAYGNKSKATLLAAQSIAYNSSFESGAFNTRSGNSTGGHVLVYLKSDGTIGKALQPVTGATPLYMSNASHLDEDLTKVHYWREFGSGRADDFSTLTSTGNAAFTLDDGTTTFVGSGVAVQGANNGMSIATNTTGFWTITFVGTGLDVIRNDNNSGVESNIYQVYVDGSSVGYMNQGYAVDTVVKVCSGLPYGTHTVKVSRATAAVFSLSIKGFKVYGPKKPTLPTGAVELADYYVMADFVANAASAATNIATGVLRKAISIREGVYTGAGWTPSLSPSYATGWGTDSNTASNTLQYTFWGTGFDFRFYRETNGSSNIAVTLNGLAAATTNFSTLVTDTYTGNTAFNTGTGVLSQNGTTASASGVVIRGLPLGKYTVVFTNNNNPNLLRTDAFDIITPIHCPKPNSLTEVQNTLPVGSCSIGDLRKIYSTQGGDRQTATSKLLANQSTTSTAFVPVYGLGIPFVGKGKKVRISYALHTNQNTSGQACLCALFVGSVQVSDGKGMGMTGTTTAVVVTSDSVIVTLSPGVHWIQAYFRAWASGTATIISDGAYNSTLSVEEL